MSPTKPKPKPKPKPWPWTKPWTKWHLWTNEKPHPWVKKIGEDEENGNLNWLGQYCHESRVYTPEGQEWPILNLRTQLLVPGPGCHANKAIVPAVNISATLKTGPDDQWDEAPFHAGIPCSLICHALQMLQEAAWAAMGFKK